MKKFLVPIVLFMCISLSGCDPIATIQIANLEVNMMQTRQVIITHIRGISFESELIYGKSPNDPNIVLVKVKEVYPNSDAEKVGIQIGDEILEVNGKGLYMGGEVIASFFATGEVPIKFKMKRGQYIYTVTLKSL